MINKKQKPKYESSEELYGYKADDEWEKLMEFMEEERAWLFYESGVQDMREIKSLYSVFKF
jgi:hypothetical protein